MPTLVSVIIPTYNRAHLITDAIDSVLNQTYTNFELLIVDDHSTDNTKVVVEQYEDVRVKYLVNKRRKGAPGARNTGLDIAGGEWVQFLDSDDILLSNKIEKQIELIDDKVEFIVGEYRELCAGGNEKIIRSDENPWVGLIRSKLGITSANLFQKNKLLEINGWNEALKSSQEYDLMFRLLKNGAKVTYDRSINTMIKIGDNSVSQSKNRDRLKEILETRFQLRDQIRSYLRSEGIWSEDLQVIYDKYIFDQLWFNKYDHPQFFREEMDKRSFNLDWRHKFWRAFKSTVRGNLDKIKSAV